MKPFLPSKTFLCIIKLLLVIQFDSNVFLGLLCSKRLIGIELNSVQDTMTTQALIDVKMSSTRMNIFDIAETQFAHVWMGRNL